MDYKELLKKYMAHVIDCESISFLDQIGDCHTDVEFTEEEVQELGRLEQEIRQ